MCHSVTLSMVVLLVLTARWPLAADERKSPALTIPRNRMMHDGTVSSVAFNPNGKTLASESNDETIKLWDVKPSQVSRPFSMVNSLSSFSLSLSVVFLPCTMQ